MPLFMYALRFDLATQGEAREQANNGFLSRGLCRPAQPPGSGSAGKGAIQSERAQRLHSALVAASLFFPRPVPLDAS